MCILRFVTVAHSSTVWRWNLFIVVCFPSFALGVYTKFTECVNVRLLSLLLFFSVICLNGSVCHILILLRLWDAVATTCNQFRYNDEIERINVKPTTRERIKRENWNKNRINKYDKKRAHTLQMQSHRPIVRDFVTRLRWRSFLGNARTHVHTNHTRWCYQIGPLDILRECCFLLCQKRHLYLWSTRFDHSHRSVFATCSHRMHSCLAKWILRFKIHSVTFFYCVASFFTWIESEIACYRTYKK